MTCEYWLIFCVLCLNCTYLYGRMSIKISIRSMFFLEFPSRCPFTTCTPWDHSSVLTHTNAIMYTCTITEQVRRRWLWRHWQRHCCEIAPKSAHSAQSSAQLPSSPSAARQDLRVYAPDHGSSHAVRKPHGTWRCCSVEHTPPPRSTLN